MIEDGRSKGIEFVLPVDFMLQDGRAAETIGPGDQQFDVGPKTSELFEQKVGEFIAASRNRRRTNRSPSTTACSACSRTRVSKRARSTSSPS